MSNIVVNTQEIPETRKYWVVRAGKDSKYYTHFRRHNIIAIGHTNSIDMGEVNGELTDENKATLLTKFKSHLSKTSDNKQHNAKQYSQVSRFINGIKPGDTVITMAKDALVTGKVISSCYLDATPLNYDIDGDEKSLDCNYSLRYAVQWGDMQARQYLPYTVEQSLRNPGTVFRISDESKVMALNHWLHPVHFCNGEVRCSINIQSKEKLANRNLTRLSSVFDKLELLTHYLEKLETQDQLDTATVESFIQYIRDHADDFEYQLTAQHAFMSPGHEFVQLKCSAKQRLIFALAFSAAFNSNVTLATEIDNAEKINDKVIELVSAVKDDKVAKAMKSLAVKMPKQNEYDVEFEIPVAEKKTML